MCRAGVDAIKALRGWLKRGLRDFGLRCLAIQEEKGGELEMVSISERYGSSFLTAQDVEKGELNLRIAYFVADEDVSGKNRDVVHFSNNDRSLILNPTNGRRLGRLPGDNPEKWKGRWITLYHDPNVEYQGNIVGGIRVSDKLPTPPAEGNGPLPEPPPQRERPVRSDDLDDSVPF